MAVTRRFPAMLVKRKKCFRILLVFFAIFSVFVPQVISAERFEYSQPPVIKVFCPEGNGMVKHIAQGKNVKHSGYIYDYLYEIGQYNNWLYEFVEDEGLSVVEMLEQDKAHIAAGIGTAYTEDNSIFISKREFIKMPAGLYAMSSDRKEYDLPRILKGQRIGFISGYQLNTVFEKYLSDNNIKSEIIYYDNIRQVDDAMQSGVISYSFIIGNPAGRGYLKILNFGSEPLYFAALAKNAGMIQKLDLAAEAVDEIDPDFTENLFVKHFDKKDRHRPSFTTEEIEYLSSAGPVKVGSCLAGYPFEFRQDTNTAKGIGPDIVEILREYTGLKFSIINTRDYTEAMQGVRAGKIDLLPYVKRNFDHGLFHNYRMTQPYLKIPVVMVTREDNGKSPSQIALPVSFSLSEKIREMYPKASVLYFSSVAECFKIIEQKKADMVFTNSDAAEYLLSFGKYSDMNISVVKGLFEEAAMAVSKKADPRLFSIINKALGAVPDSRLNELTIKYSLGARRRDFRDIAKIYPVEIGFTAAAVMAVITLLLAFTAAGKYREKKKMEDLYYRDQVTGYNSFSAFLEKAEKIIKFSPERRFAIVRMNIVEFKFINDTLGYAAGDSVLRKISDMLNEFADKECETFARIYADKFVMLLCYVSSSDLGSRIDMLCHKFTELSERISGSPIIVNGGICVMDRKDMTIKTAVDHAAFAEKELLGHRHSNAFIYYSDKVLQDIGNEKAIERSMREALKNGHFVPYLQPKVNCRTLKVVGAEALARWIDPEKGVIMPGDFIPYFEKSGFITELDLYIFEQVCAILRKWIDAGKEPVPVSCNFSYRDICDGTLGKIRDVVDKYNIPKEMLEIEITETMAIENLDTLSIYGSEINRYGLKLCVDDFGAGYSSISLLQKMSIDILKFDRELIVRGTEKKFSEDILKGLIKTLKKHSVQIICEGIETEGQRDFVRSMGCDVIQGFLYSQPLPVEEFEKKYLKTRHKKRAEPGAS